MSEDAKSVVPGLKGIKAADSSICFIDGQIGKLIYRGYNIDELARKSTYEEVAFLLLYGELPSSGELEKFHESLTAHATAPAAVLTVLKSLPRESNPMASLRPRNLHFFRNRRRKTCLQPSTNCCRKLPLWSKQTTMPMR